MQQFLIVLRFQMVGLWLKNSNLKLVIPTEKIEEGGLKERGLNTFIPTNKPVNVN